MFTVEQLDGTWHGLSQLHLNDWPPGSGDRVFESESSLALHAVASNPVLDGAYTWSHDNEQQTGRYMIVVAGNDVEVAWTDTWHMAGQIMHCKGTLTEKGMVFQGSYGGGDEVWGWRTELRMLAPNVMELHMTNITPSGEEDWAVKAAYSKQ
ncbi:MAG: DUF1579 family protein [Chthonomonas sp.]|nr:DUF1579 family protein [Chthonomonas sp.]